MLKRCVDESKTRLARNEQELQTRSKQLDAARRTIAQLHSKLMDAKSLGTLLARHAAQANNVCQAMEQSMTSAAHRHNETNTRLLDGMRELRVGADSKWLSKYEPEAQNAKIKWLESKVFGLTEQIKRDEKWRLRHRDDLCWFSLHGIEARKLSSLQDRVGQFQEMLSFYLFNIADIVNCKHPVEFHLGSDAFHQWMEVLTEAVHEALVDAQMAKHYKEQWDQAREKAYTVSQALAHYKGWRAHRP